MYTLCVTQNFTEAQYVNELMSQMDPSGEHRTADTIEDAERIIGNARPDIVWLAVGEESFALAENERSASPNTNYIFAAPDRDLAYEAIRAHASGYILQPVTEEAVRSELEDLRHPLSEDNRRLRVQCFGNFEVFSQGKIVRFARSLSKEALAYLVDRRGAGCTVAEICSVLWDDRMVDTNLKSQCRVILASLKKDLEAVGASDVLVKGWNTWGIDADKIACDYYDFLRNSGKMTDVYRGEYLAQYSWAEMTSGSLYQMTSE